MSTIELRRQISTKISNLEDENLLTEINELLNAKSQENYFEITDFELKRAETARKHQLDGTLISNNQVRKNVEQWLKSK